MSKLKKFVVCTFAVLMLCGCYNNDSQMESTESKKINETPIGAFIEIERGITYKIVYHRDTKVMYAVSNAITLLVNADGTPMVYEG